MGLTLLTNFTAVTAISYRYWYAIPNLLYDGAWNIEQLW